MRIVERPRVVPICVLLLALAGPAAAVHVTLEGATVSKPGEDVEVCVSMQNQGQTVAGIENDLIWDSRCLTIVGGPDTCQPRGTHGKSVNGGDPRAAGDFTMSMHILVLSIADVDPMKEGSVYCCKARSELTEGSCPIQISGKASDPSGKRLNVTTTPGAITFSSSGKRGGGSGGGGGPAGPLSAVGGATGGGPGAPAGAAPGGGGVAGGIVGQQQPPAVVVPGGVPGEVPVEQAPPIPGQEIPAGEAPAPERFAATPIGGFVAAATPAATADGTAAEAEPTTVQPAPTTPVAGTPTSKPTQPPTAKPTLAPTPKKDDGGGWFGCQVVSGAGDCSALVIVGLLGAVALRVRRRRR